MTKIITRVGGGIGNQLFTYAAARRLALINNAELVIDDISGFDRDHDYQRQYQLDHFNILSRKATAAERLEPFSRIRRYIKRRLSRYRSFKDRTYIHQEGIDFDVRLLQFKTFGTVYLEGYWQSEDYFKDVAALIRSDLRIQPPNDDCNNKLAARIRDSLAVAVHVRFFDAPAKCGVNNAPGDYYVRAVNHMETIVPGAHYFVFSDRPDAARVLIPLPEGRFTLVTHNKGDVNAYADLWLMTQCKHFVIANSTFSWWGAWLSQFSEKQVLAPEFEMRGDAPSRITSWGFKGLLPGCWIKI